MECKKMTAKLWGLNTLCLTFMFGLSIFYPHYSQDDYSMNYEQPFIGGLLAGKSMRPILGISYWLLSKLKINVVQSQFFFGVILLISFIFCTTKLTLLLVDKMNAVNDAPKTMLINLATLFLLGNAFVSEWMYFAEAYIQWAIAVLGLTMSITALAKCGKKKIYFIYSTAFLFLAIGSYQIIAVQFAVIALFIVYAEQGGKVNKATLIKAARAASIGILAMACNIFVSKPIGILLGYNDSASRMAIDFKLLGDILVDFIKKQRIVWIDGMGTLPQWSMPIVCILLLANILLRQKKIQNLLWCLAIWLTAEGMLCSVEIMQGHCSLAARKSVPIFAVMSVLVWMNVYTQQNDFSIKANVVYLIPSVFLLINFVEVQINAVDVIKTNAIDKEIIMQINKKIQTYENNTGITVTTIGFTPDQNKSYKYYDVLVNNVVGDFALRSFSTTWSDYHSFYYITGRSLNWVNVPEEYKAQFTSMDWSTLLLEEQMVFEQDAVWICVY